MKRCAVFGDSCWHPNKALDEDAAQTVRRARHRNRYLQFHDSNAFLLGYEDYH